MAEPLPRSWSAAAATVLVSLGAAVALVALLGNSAGGHFRAKTQTLLMATTTATSYSNEDTFVFNFTQMTNTPLGIWSNLNGTFVVAADEEGHIWRSIDAGSSWEKTKPLKIGKSSQYASVYGLAMTSDGAQMVVGTGKHSTYQSTDYGSSWNQISTQHCSIIASESSLEKLACIGGLTTGNNNYIYYSTDAGATWSKSSADPGRYVGLVASTDFGMVSAVKYTNEYYFHNSSDGAVTFSTVGYDENGSLRWGSLCGSADLSTMLLTDVKTRNVHVSRDYGANWFQAFNAESFKLSDSVTLNACAVSSDGNAYAIAFTGAKIYTVFNCPDPATEKQCGGLWVEQDSASSTGVFDTAGLAFSQDGGLFFSVDATNEEIAVGVIETVDDDDDDE